MKVEVRKCNICKNTIVCFNNTPIKCCEEEMIKLKENTTDASYEKHIPNYEINNNEIIVSVNHVMEENHYIMWIMVVYNNGFELKEFKPGNEPQAIFKYEKNSKIYSMCNLHDLWSVDVE